MRCVPSSRMSFPDLSAPESLDAASIKLAASQQRLCQNRALPQSPSRPGWAHWHEQTHPAHRWLLKPPKHDWHSEGGRDFAACSLMFRLGEPILMEHGGWQKPGAPSGTPAWRSLACHTLAFWLCARSCSLGLQCLICEMRMRKMTFRDFWMDEIPSHQRNNQWTVTPKYTQASLGFYFGSSTSCPAIPNIFKVWLWIPCSSASQAPNPV